MDAHDSTVGPSRPASDHEPGESAEREDVAVFEASRELNLVGGENAAGPRNLGSATYCAPAFANGVLYLIDRQRLFAIRRSGTGAAVDSRE